MIDNDLIFWEYADNQPSPLIVVIESENVKMMKKIFGFLSIGDNMKYVSRDDIHYLLKKDHLYADNFLSILF